MRKKFNQVWVLSCPCFLSLFLVTFFPPFSVQCMGFLEHRHVHTLHAGILHHSPSLLGICKGQPKGVNSIAGMITFTICSIDSAVSIMALWSASKYIYNVNSAKQKHFFGVVSFPGYGCLHTTIKTAGWEGLGTRLLWGLQIRNFLSLLQLILYQ